MSEHGRSYLRAGAFAPIAIATRSGVDESLHHGAGAIVAADGSIVRSVGDPETLVYPRSALKPFQAVPFIARGGHVRYGFTPPEIAVMCASHSGEPRHEAAVRSILAKSGRHESELLCGTHPPIFYTLNGSLPCAGEVFTPVQHNCSGKHAGMLAFCTLTGTAPENYIDPDHPIQQAIRLAVAEFAGLPEDSLGVGVDGCSAPNFALPLAALARAFARLATDGDDPVYGEAPRTIFAAMTAAGSVLTSNSGLGVLR